MIRRGRTALRLGAVLAVVTIAIGFAGCGSGTSGEGSSGRATTATTPSSASDDPVTAYRDAVAAYALAAAPPDPGAAVLEAAYTGDALLKARVALGRSLADGIGARGGRTVVSASLTAQADDSATVAACVRDDQEQYRLSDGAVVAPAPGTTSAVVITLARIDGRWKVSAIAPGAGC